ncbi:olfactory receptor 52B2-like [Betta splendens]|uniref:Olfactory receptor n=1 Tax=Betta splendens TaxID=158456 RepID=A0A6P7P4C6_BETSP|nr:olfactory receptor 52B2-like [Betta splendens]
MIYTNITTIKDFIITGFPGLSPEYYGCVSFLLLLIFLAILFGNTFIVSVIIYERTLHKPVYLIIIYLAVTDTTFGIVTIPKILARYWWNDMKSSFGACFTQMYFVHSLGAFTSSVLMIMAFDRFIAIWLPFQYPVLITNKSVCVACSLCCVVTFTRMLGLVLHALSVPYCNLNVITQCFCDHVSIIQLGCGENVAYVKFVAFVNAMFSLLGPLTIICISYLCIIIAAVKMSYAERHNKVLSTCAPQIFITCLYYVPRCFVYLSSNLGFTFSIDVRVIITMMYSLIPCAVNPLVYCLKTKDIKKVLVHRFKRRQIDVAFKLDNKHNIN